MQANKKIPKQLNQSLNLNSEQLEQPKQRSIQSQSYYVQSQLQILRNNPELISQGQPFKGCNCKKSKCTKNYCECFYFGARCSDTCRCVSCLNGPLSNYPNLTNNHSNLSSNVNNSIQNFQEIFQNRKNKILSKGCNCKKSGCQKKYCECFNVGATCNALCKCEECKNIIAQDFEDNLESENKNLDRKEENARKREVEVAPKSLQTNEMHEQKASGSEKDGKFSQKLKNLLENVDTNYQQSILQYLRYMLS